MKDIPASMSVPPLAKTKEIAQHFRCSESYVREMIRDGRLHALVVGRSLRIPRESVEAFVAGRKP